MGVHVLIRCCSSAAAILATGVPFGGYKDSGIGREKSEYALQAYTQVCTSNG
jgi:acyl-CoA reductase-like NAD-dependent aldehyde dehydrogenase